MPGLSETWGLEGPGEPGFGAVCRITATNKVRVITVYEDKPKL